MTVEPLDRWMDHSAEGAVFAAVSSESRMQGAVRRVTTAAALANAEGPLGAWAMSLPGFLAEVSYWATLKDKIVYRWKPAETIPRLCMQTANARTWCAQQ